MNSFNWKSERHGGDVALYCFSPAVILITFTIEAALAVYTWFRYRASRFGRLSAAFLALLSVFQVSELFICHGAPEVFWARVGFIATAFLPIIGIDMIYTLVKRPAPVALGYALATAFGLMMAFMPNAIQGASCTGRFVAFTGQLTELDITYGLYYLTTLLWGIGLIIQSLQTKQAARNALVWLLIGYLSFMLPTMGLYIFVVASHSGLGSILCGFAILLALIHVLKVLPAAEPASRSKKV